MLVEDLHRWLESRGYNQLATDVNRAAGLYADAKADAESKQREPEHGDRLDFEDTPEAAGG